MLCVFIQNFTRDKKHFRPSCCNEVIARINELNSDSQPLWGKMSVDQMLAHCNVTYEYVFEPDKYKKPNAFVGLMLKLFVKGIVTNEKPYKKSSQTAPDFIIQGNKDFDAEKSRLIDFIQKTQALGAQHFDGLASHSFGKLDTKAWNNMFYKHLNHHLEQFGV